jgi:hypothetical protein
MASSQKPVVGARAADARFHVAHAVVPDLDGDLVLLELATADGGEPPHAELPVRTVLRSTSEEDWRGRRGRGADREAERQQGGETP